MESWTLDPTVTHLNHGSFGGCPRSVLDVQAAWRVEMESNPVRFFVKTLQPAIEQSRRTLADFVGATPADLVFVPNATAGINTVFRSLEPSLGSKDEILTTDHAYNACRNIAEVSAQRTGARLVEAPVPFPIESADQFADVLLNRVTARTRVVMIDAVTSPTAVVVRLTRIVAELEPSIPVLIDGAHAPGMVPLDLNALGASFVVGNCHKWMCAPKSAGFLYVREDRQAEIVPASVSHGWNTETPSGSSRFHNLFDWTGTDDPTARLSVPAAIETMAGMHNDGWTGVMTANRQLVLDGRQILCDRLGIDLPTPNVVIGSMATVPLPGPRGDGAPGDLDPLTDRLREEWQIEVPVFSWRDWPRRLLRISAQRYNQLADYEHLATALKTALCG